MKLLKVFMIFGVILLIFSCSDDSDIKEPSNIEEEVEKRQAGLGDGWEPAACVNITIFIDPDACGPNWEASLPAAIAEYNSVPGAAINMVQVFSAPADIEITCADFANNNSFGLGEWPDADGVIGGNIFMNTDFESSCTDPCFHTGAMMHEISHNLGYCHGQQEGGPGQVGPWTLNADGTFTQVNDGQETQLEHIDGTMTGIDPNSIFNVHNCASPNCTFTPDDILALQAFYPLCECAELSPCQCDITEATLEGPEALCLDLDGDEVGTFCVSSFGSGATITATVDGNSVSSSGNCIDYTFPTIEGTYTITIEICEGECCRTFTREVVIYAQDCDERCYCECWEEVDGGKKVKYVLVQMEINCWEDCDEVYGGDPLFNCTKKTYDCDGTPPDVSLDGPDEICEEEGYVTICVSGYIGATSWTINGPNLSETENSNNNCLSFDVEPGTYTFSTTVCDGDCCVNLSHTVTVTAGPCEEECYCVCEEGDGDGGYTTVELPIDCNEDCAEQYPEGDEYFDCRKMYR